MSPVTAYDELIHRVEQFANRTKATPVATGLSIVQMLHLWRPRIEAEARADADAQVAALREALEHAIEYVYEWGTKNESSRIDAVLADTASAAKAHDEALVKPWREAIERAANEGRNVVPDATDDQSAIIESWARALLRDSE